MGKASFSVPRDRICIVLFGLTFAFIGLFPILIFMSPVLLGVQDVPDGEFWGTLLLLVLVTAFAVIGIAEVIRGLTIRSDPLGLRMPNASGAAEGGAATLGAVVTGARFVYTWGFRVVLFLLAGAILAGGLYFTSMTLSTIQWSAARPTIWLALYAAILVLPTIALVGLNLWKRVA